MTTAALPAGTPTVTDSGLTHVVCCRDDDPAEIALCGTDVTDDPWVSPDTKTTCVVCTYFDNAGCDPDSAVCPFVREAT